MKTSIETGTLVFKFVLFKLIDFKPEGTKVVFKRANTGVFAEV